MGNPKKRNSNFRLQFTEKVFSKIMGFAHSWYRKQYNREITGESFHVEVGGARHNRKYEESSVSSIIPGYDEKKQTSLDGRDDYNNNLLSRGGSEGVSEFSEYKKTFPRKNHHITRTSGSDSYFLLAKHEIEKEKRRLHSLDLSHNLVAELDTSNTGTKTDSSKDNVSLPVDQLVLGSLGDPRTTPSSLIQSNEVEQSRRRSSSLSSIPPYFYPDPYSIVVSRYWEELGSLSTYSPASGSQATEYLQLSQAATPEEPLDLNKSARRSSFTAQSSLLSRRIGSGDQQQSGGETELLEDDMNFDSALSTSEEYQSFRSSVPLRKICVEADGSKEWKVYDAGPKSVRTPLLCVGPACATADVFYKQILNLTARGLRVISVEGPVYWTVDDWCKGLKKLLDCLNLDKVHILGASLGGFLAQKFAEYTYHYSRVASLILCNTFLDTSIFDYHDSAMIFWMLPSVILKKLIVENITAARIMDLEIAHAIEFMIERLNNLSQQELASRMTLNCVNCHVDTFKLKQIKMSIMDVFDESALSNQARDDLYQHYSDAKLAHLKSGGNFPYLSRSEDVSMHILVHLRTFIGTKHSAQMQESPSPSLPIGSSTSTVEAGSSTRNSHPTEAEQSIASSSQKYNAEDVFGSTDTQSMPIGSVEDKNQAFKEKAASVLGLPVQ